MPKPRAIVYRPPASKEYAAGPWTRVRDRAGDLRPDAALVMRNLQRDVQGVGSCMVSRPGFGIPYTPNLSGKTYGRGGPWVHRDTTGTYTGFCVDQKVYYLSGNVLVDTLCPTGAGVGLTAPTSTTSDDFLVYGLSVGLLFVLNPNNGSKPVYYTPSTGVWAQIALAPAFYGPLRLHYGSLIGVRWDDRLTVEWSNPGDILTGYASAVPAQQWQMRQVSVQPINALAVTNERMYVFRAQSIQSVLGPPDDFVSSATEEDVSKEHGSVSPASVLIANGVCWFVDQHGEIQRFAVNGEGVEKPSVSEQCRQTLRGTVADTGLNGTGGVNTSALGTAVAAIDPDSDNVLFLLPALTSGASDTPQVTSSVYRMLLQFDQNGGFLGTWTRVANATSDIALDLNYFDAHSIGTCYVAGRWRLGHLTSQFWAWQLQREPMNTGWIGQPYYLDYGAYGSGLGSSIRPLVEAGPLAGSDEGSKSFELVRVFTQGTVSSLSMQYRTTLNTAWTTALVQSTSGVSDDGRLTFGIHGYGRALRVRVWSQYTSGGNEGQLFPIVRFEALGRIVSSEPYSR